MLEVSFVSMDEWHVKKTCLATETTRSHLAGLISAVVSNRCGFEWAPEDEEILDWLIPSKRAFGLRFGEVHVLVSPTRHKLSFKILR